MDNDQRAIIEAIINDEETLMEMTTAIFNEVDEDGSGEIDREELKIAMASFSNQIRIG